MKTRVAPEPLREKDSGGYVFVVNEDTCCAGAVEGERFGFLAGGSERRLR